MGVSETENDPAIWICRHGNRIDFVDSSWKGTDPHLSADGIVQAKETGIRLKNEDIRHIFASPFLRAVETAHYIAEALDLTVKIEHGACEWLNPNWFIQTPTYIPLDQLRKRFQRVDDTYKSIVFAEFPESQDKANIRFRKLVLLLAETYSSTSILVVGHGATLIGMTKALIGDDCDVSWGLCALVKVGRVSGRSVLQINGDVSHLSGGKQCQDRLV